MNVKLVNKAANIKCKKLTSLQHRCWQSVRSIYTRPSKMIFAVLDV